MVLGLVSDSQLIAIASGREAESHYTTGQNCHEMDMDFP